MNVNRSAVWIDEDSCNHLVDKNWVAVFVEFAGIQFAVDDGVRLHEVMSLLYWKERRFE